MGDLMKDDHKTKKQLIHKLTELRSQNTALKKSITVSVSADLVVEEARRYAESIVETVRESLLVLDTDLKIISANRNFYRAFKVTPDETIGSFIYDLGNKQWDIPKLRELLKKSFLKKKRSTTSRLPILSRTLVIKLCCSMPAKYIGKKSAQR